MCCCFFFTLVDLFVEKVILLKQMLNTCAFCGKKSAHAPIIFGARLFFSFFSSDEQVGFSGKFGCGRSMIKLVYVHCEYACNWAILIYLDYRWSFSVFHCKIIRKINQQKFQRRSINSVCVDCHLLPYMCATLYGSINFPATIFQFKSIDYLLQAICYRISCTFPFRMEYEIWCWNFILLTSLMSLTLLVCIQIRVHLLKAYPSVLYGFYADYFIPLDFV